MDKELEILKNLSKYLQLKIDSGEHKIIYNDLMWDEKTIDCINAIETLIQALENSIPTSVVEEKIKEYKKIAEKVDKIPETVKEERLDGSVVYSQRFNADGYIAEIIVKILQELLQKK